MTTAQQEEADIEYCGRIYYDDTKLNVREVHFIITKNLKLFSKVRLVSIG